MTPQTPLTPSDVVDVTLRCNTPGAGTAISLPPVPVRVANWSLSGIGVNQGCPSSQP